MKRSEIFKNLITDFIIFLFVLKRKSSDHIGKYLKAFHEISFLKLDLKHKYH